MPRHQLFGPFVMDHQFFIAIEQHEAGWQRFHGFQQPFVGNRCLFLHHTLFGNVGKRDCPAAIAGAAFVDQKDRTVLKFPLDRSLRVFVMLKAVFDKLFLPADCARNGFALDACLNQDIKLHPGRNDIAHVRVQPYIGVVAIDELVVGIVKREALANAVDGIAQKLIAFSRSLGGENLIGYVRGAAAVAAESAIFIENRLAADRKMIRLAFRVWNFESKISKWFAG